MHPACESLSTAWQDPWQEPVNMHPGCECLSSVWQDQDDWWNWWTCIQHVSVSLVFDRIRTTYENGEHASSLWVPLQCLRGPEPLMRTGEHTSSVWVPLQYFTGSEPLTRAGEHASRSWVPLQYLTWSEPLMRPGEHASSEWVFLQCLTGSEVPEPLMRMTCIQYVSASSVCADQNHWQDANIHMARQWVLLHNFEILKILKMSNIVECNYFHFLCFSEISLTSLRALIWWLF